MGVLVFTSRSERLSVLPFRPDALGMLRAYGELLPTAAELDGAPTCA